MRAGKSASSIEEFRTDGLLAIGWTDIGPVAPDISDNELADRFKRHYPDEREAGCGRRSGGSSASSASTVSFSVSTVHGIFFRSPQRLDLRNHRSNWLALAEIRLTRIPAEQCQSC